MTQESASTDVPMIEMWLMQLPEYEHVPRGEGVKTQGGYGMGRGNQRHRITHSVQVRVRTQKGIEIITLPADSEVCLYRPFRKKRDGQILKEGDAQVATVFYPNANGQVSVNSSLRSSVVMFSHRLQA